MKKNDIFTFTAPNGVEVTAIVVYVGISDYMFTFRTTELICYSQNRLFTYMMKECRNFDEEKYDDPIYYYGKVIVDYAILPDYDAMLEAYLSKKSCEEEANTLTEKELYL